MRLSRTARAEQDIDDIWLYIARDSERAADRLIAKLEAASLRLEEFPQLGIARDDLAPELRALRVDNYILFYRARGDMLVLERVLHARVDTAAAKF